MKVLVIGSGGREHALAWKLAQSPRVSAVFVAPGNAGTATEPGVSNVPIEAGDSGALIDFARAEDIALTVVGPEGPLVDGVVDRFQEAGLRIFGPNAAAARLEGSKIFCKEFLARHHIPTARYASFTELPDARRWIVEHGAPVVIKADGLAAGKGVIIAPTVAGAIEAAEQMLEAEVFGSAGRRVVVEEFLEGEEASFIVMVGGGRVLALASSQDHKALNDGDTGPNTGGMGAYSPAPVVSDALHARILDEIIRPTVDGLAAEGTPYTGFLYAGLMIGSDGTPRVLEYNCRFGDPETQPILMRLRGDLAELCEAALDDSLPAHTEWDERVCLGVVMAAGGYPGRYATGEPIEGLDDEQPDTRVFQAGTALRDGRVVTAGGRVLCVCALGADVAEAQARAYRRVASLRWPGAVWRTDIGHRALARR